MYYYHLFSVFCSLFSVNQSISTVVCSSQLYSEGGGASQPRSKQVSWTFANAEVIGNWSLDFALEYQVYTSYVGE